MSCSGHGGRLQVVVLLCGTKICTNLHAVHFLVSDDEPRTHTALHPISSLGPFESLLTIQMKDHFHRTRDGVFSIILLS